MKTKTTLRRSLLLATGSSLLAVSSASAQSGSWLNDNAGNWTDAARWTSGAIANGVDNTATFGNVIASDRTVTLNGDRTIGNITASDTSHNYTISGANILTLDRTTGTPIIDVTTAGRTLTISSQISGNDGLRKNGSGSLNLNTTASTFTGEVNISAGRLLVDAAAKLLGNANNNIVVASGAQLFAPDTGTMTRTGNTTISGTGINDGGSQNTYFGALRFYETTYDGTITLAAASRIGSLVFGNANINTISGKITGAFGVDFFGATTANNGIVNHIISNTGNDYTGNTTISNGGYNSAAVTSRTNLRLGASNVIPNGASAGNVVFSLDGTNNASTVALDLNGFSETINGLTVNAGAFTSRITNGATTGTSASVLTIGDNNTTSSFSGIIEDNDATRTLGITKIGSGTLTLVGDSSYRGVTTISAGAITITHANALGSTAGNTTIAATGSNTGGVLQLSGGITTAENITITGTTEAGSYFGAIRSTSGNNTVSGNITLAGSANIRLEANGGNLTFSGSITQTGTARPLVLEAESSRTLTVNNAIANNYGSLITDQAGTVILKGVSGSGIGNTTMFGGTLKLGVTDALNTTRPLELYTDNSPAPTFDLAGFNQTINALIGSGAGATANRKVINAVAGTSTLTVGNGGGSGTFNGQINTGTGNIQLIKTGAGNQTLSGNNSFTGGTRIDNGILTLGNATDTLANTGAVNVNGGTLALGTNSDTVGAVTLTSGSITGSGAGTLTGASYDVQSGSVSAILGGTSVALTKTTTGTVTLSGANTYTGNTTVSGGTLKITGAGRLYSAAYNGSAVLTVQNGGVLELDTWFYGASESLGQLAKEAARIVINNGTIRMNGTTEYGRGVTVLAGGATFEAATGANWTHGGGDLTANVYTGNPSLTFTGAGNGTYGKEFSGSGSLTKSGAGTWTLSVANSYTGGTNVKEGTLTLGHATDTLANTGAVNVNGGTLALGTYTDTVGAVTLTSGSITGSGAGTLTGTSYDVRSGSVSAKLGGTGVTLTKTTTGTVTLSGANTYTGTTTISTVGGVLQANDGTGLPSASFLSLDGGVLQSNGVSTFNRTLHTSGASKLQFTANGGGFSARDGQLTVNLGGSSAEQVWGTTVGTHLVGTLQFGSTTANNKTLFENPIDLNTADRTIHVTAGVGNDLAEISGVIRTSSGTAGLIKTGNGTLRLTNANTFNGATDISGGTLELSGASGAIAFSSGVSIGGGATLKLDNTTNNPNRLNGTVTMTGGTLEFFHPADNATYSESAGFLDVSGLGNTIKTSQAGSSGTSTLTFASLNITGGASELNFIGTDLGLTNRNQIKFTTSPTLNSSGLIANAKLNGNANVTYSINDGVVPAIASDSIAIQGGVIPNGYISTVSIDSVGTSGQHITLFSPNTAITTLTQNYGGPETGTVSMSGEILRMSNATILAGKSALTFGTLPAGAGAGTLMSRDPGGKLDLSNLSETALMTVNAVIEDNTNNSGSTLSKTGVGTLVLAGAATYTGATAIQEGTLQLAGANRLPTGTVLTLGAGGTSGILKLDGNSQTLGGLTTGGGTGNRVVNGSANAATLTLGGSSTFGGVLGGAEGSPDEVEENNFSLAVSGSPTLTGSNTFTGGVTLNGGTLIVSTVASTGTPQPLGKGATPITFTAAATLAITGGGSTDRGLVLGDHANTLSVADGKTVAMSGNITGGGDFAYFYKTGAGTFNYSGSEAWNGNLHIQQGAFEVSGSGATPGPGGDGIGETRLTGSSTLRITSSAASLSTASVVIGTGTTVVLQAGTLRTNAITKTGTFTWGSVTSGVHPTLATLDQIVGGDTKDRTDNVDGAPSGPVVREGNILDFTGTLATGVRSRLDLGDLYLNAGVRYNQLTVSGQLNLSGVDDTLNFEINPGFLRPTSPNSVTTGDWGTLILVRAASFALDPLSENGETPFMFSAITGIQNDMIGWTAADGSGSYNQGLNQINPKDLAINTYYLEYRTGYTVPTLAGESIQAPEAVILFHYKVSGSVPEPGSAGLMIAGAMLLRALRRRRL